MITRGSVARSVRESKERHPDKYCKAPGCLWRTSNSPCQKHPVAGGVAGTPARPPNIYERFARQRAELGVGVRSGSKVAGRARDARRGDSAARGSRGVGG